MFFIQPANPTLEKKDSAKNLIKGRAGKTDVWVFLDFKCVLTSPGHIFRGLETWLISSGDDWNSELGDILVFTARYRSINNVSSVAGVVINFDGGAAGEESRQCRRVELWSR